MPTRNLAMLRLGWCWLLSVLILGGTAYRVRERVTASNGPGRTIMAGSTTVPATTDRGFRFLTAIAQSLPPGASVAFVRSAHRSTLDDNICYMIAVGQLPDQKVLPANAVDGLLRDAPEFVASFEGDFDHPRYTVVRRMEYGVLYRRVSS